MRKFTYYVIFGGAISIAASYQVKKSPQFAHLSNRLYLYGIAAMVAGIPLLYVTRRIEKRQFKEQALFHCLASCFNTDQLIRPACQWIGKGKERFVYEVTSDLHPGVLVNENTYARLYENMAARMGGPVTVVIPSGHHPKVIVSLKEDMPASADHPPDLSTRSRALPYGVTHGNRILAWDPKKISHCLVVGMPNAGKTVALIGMVLEAMRRHYQIVIVDPKRTSFRGLAKLLRVETENTTMAKAIDDVFEEMEKRYRDMKAGKVYQEDLRSLLLVVDEYSEFSARMKESWAEKGEHPALIKFRQIVRLGREAGIHLLVGTQRPDAAIMTGEARANFGLILALGKLNTQSKQMVGATGHISRHVPGRGLAIYGDDEIEVQMFRTPDPAGRLTAEDERLIGALLEGASLEGSPKRSHAKVTSSQGGSPADSQGTSVPKGLPEKLTEEKISEIEQLARQRLDGKWALTYEQLATQAGVSIGAAHKYGSKVRRLRVVGEEATS